MALSLSSYNCRGFNVSKVKLITILLEKFEIVMLQETWLLEKQVGSIGKYFPDHNTYGISGINDTVLLSGRPYGGLSFIYKKSISANIEPVHTDSNRFCCIRIQTNIGLLYLINVYMPYDTISNLNLEEYNCVLSELSRFFLLNNVQLCIVCGDINTDLSRVHSGNTISLNQFANNEQLLFVLKHCMNTIVYTFMGINNNTSLIDHFIVTESIAHCINDYFVVYDVNNASDHLPLCCILKVRVT